MAIPVSSALNIRLQACPILSISLSRMGKKFLTFSGVNCFTLAAETPYGDLMEKRGCFLKKPFSHLFPAAVLPFENGWRNLFLMAN
jgi:hypothetical protein